jgi:hypothetical protein
MTALGKKVLSILIVVVLGVIALVIRNLVVRTTVGTVENLLAPDSTTSPTEPADWTPGSCLLVASQPTLPSTVKYPSEAEKRAKEQAMTRYAPAACSDPRAFSRIIAFGTPQPGNPAEATCPDNSDGDYLPDNGDRMVCTRNLRPPHPGDPGGGGGAVVVGDCVAVSSSDGNEVTNDEVSEQPCDPGGWFAQVLARVDAPDQCPPVTVSRVSLADGRKGPVLCLVPGEHGGLATAGECLSLPGNAYTPAYKVDCGERLADRVLALAGPAQACPAGTELRLRESGYDTELCLASAH